MSQAVPIWRRSGTWAFRSAIRSSFGIPVPLGDAFDRHRSVHEPGHDHVGADAVLRVADRERLRVGVDPGLRGLVRHDRRRADGGDRRHVRDRARALGSHHGQRGLAGHDHALEIHGHDLVPDRLVDRSRSRVRPADADVVVEHVEPPEGVDRLLDEGDRVGLARRVGFDGEGRPAFLLDHRQRVLRGGQVAIDDHDLGAFAGEEDRRRSSVSDRVARGLPRTDDDRDLVLESTAHSGEISGEIPGEIVAPSSSSWTPSVLRAIETRLYCPTVKTRSISCWVS